MDEKYFKKEWFFNVTFENSPTERLKAKQKTFFRGIFVWASLSIAMFSLSFFPADSLLSNVRFLSLMSGIYFSLAFYNFANWIENRGEEKAIRKLEDDYNSRMKAKERVLADLAKMTKPLANLLAYKPRND